MERADKAVLVKRLLMERWATEAVGALGAAGVGCRVIKGVALRAQLYDAGEPRDYGDIDLLVDPSKWAAAQGVLRSIGYQPLPYAGLFGQPYHSFVTRHETSGVELDLHHRIHGIGVPSRRFWQVAGAAPVSIAVGSANLPTTPLPVTGLHLLIATLPEHGGGERHVREWGRFRERHPGSVHEVRQVAGVLRAGRAHDRALRIVAGLDRDLLPSPRRVRVTSWVDHVRFAPTPEVRRAMLRDVLGRRGGG